MDFSLFMPLSPDAGERGMSKNLSYAIALPISGERSMSGNSHMR